MSTRSARLDADDPLASLRERFELPVRPDGGPATYLCGNSLGPLPRAARERVAQTLEDWSRLAVRGHHVGPRPWMHYHEAFAAPLARIVGAAPEDVVLMNLLTVNLHLMMVSFYRPTPARMMILIEEGAFPSDRYAVDSQLRFHGLVPEQARLTVGPRPGEDLLRTEDIVAAIEAHADRLALVLLPGVQYRTGQVLDIARITAAARRAGAMIGWDLAHSVGNVPLSLADWGPDFAVWCNYKYLCGGPGAVAGAYVHERHRHAEHLPRFAGWWGHEASTRFEMGPDFRPTPGAQGWQLSNGPVLAMAPLAAALELYEQAGLARLRAKSLALTAYAFERLDATLAGEVAVIGPREDAARGCQLSLRIAGGATRARRAFDLLMERGIIGDWREPDVVRVAPHPLFNTFADVDACVDELARVLAVL